MAGSFGTVWQRYKTLFVYWGFTLLLIAAALFIQWWEADLPGRYTAVKKAEDCPLQVNVTYPTRLLLPAANTSQQTLLIQVTNAQGVEYTISLSKADWFVLYDKDGNVMSPYWEGTGDAVFAAVVKTYPDQTAAPQKHQVELNEKENSFSCSVDLGEVSVETINQSRWRLGFGIFARNIALPLGLLSAIAGWVVSYLGKETDKQETAFRVKMGKLSSEFQLDPIYAVAQCLELKKAVAKKSLGGDATKDLDETVRRLFNQEGVGRLLKQIGEYANHRNSLTVMSALELVVSFRNKFISIFIREAEFDSVLHAIEHIYRYFSNQSNFALLSDAEQPMAVSIGKWQLPSFVQEIINRIKVPQAEKRTQRAQFIIAQLLLIWGYQDVYSSDLVIYGLNRFRDVQPVFDFIQERFAASKSLRRLTRYKSLKWLGSSPNPYEWPPLQAQAEPLRYSALHHWFVSNAVINVNLFESSPKADHLLLDSRLKSDHQPEMWGTLADNHSGIFMSPFYEDLLSAALLLQDYFEGNTQQLAFPILLEYSSELKQADLLSVLAQHAAETWLEFLAYSPDAYLDMYPEERRALASWLGWHCGSLKIASERLRQRLFHVVLNISDEKKSDEKKRAGQLLLDFLEEGESPYSKDCPSSAEQFLEWLSIRPFGIEQTVILLLANEALPDVVSRSIETYQKSFRQRDIILKQFFLEKDVQPEHACAIKWSKERLKKILTVRVDSVSGGRQNFAELFESPSRIATPPDYDGQLAEKANGSLHRMLERGLKILLHHAQHHPKNRYLLPNDFDIINAS